MNACTHTHAHAPTHMHAQANTSPILEVVAVLAALPRARDPRAPVRQGLIRQL